jgi:hypothetical protein
LVAQAASVIRHQRRRLGLSIRAGAAVPPVRWRVDHQPPAAPRSAARRQTQSGVADVRIAGSAVQFGCGIPGDGLDRALGVPPAQHQRRQALASSRRRADRSARHEVRRRARTPSELAATGPRCRTRRRRWGSTPRERASARGCVDQ